MRNPFIIYPKKVSTLRISDHIYKTFNKPKNGVYKEFVDELLFILFIDEILGECIVFEGEKLIDGYIMKKTNFQYNEKTAEEYLRENI